MLKTHKGFLRKHTKNTLKMSCKNYEENIDNIADGTYILVLHKNQYICFYCNIMFPF